MRTPDGQANADLSEIRVRVIPVLILGSNCQCVPRRPGDPEWAVGRPIYPRPAPHRTRPLPECYANCPPPCSIIWVEEWSTSRATVELLAGSELVNKKWNGSGGGNCFPQCFPRTSGYVAYPRALESDLSRHEDGLRVKVLVVPSGRRGDEHQHLIRTPCQVLSEHVL
jgi:hypothetical protein